LLLAAVLSQFAAVGAAAAHDIARGNFMGSGRACYGMLTITARRITWMTPFSECKTSPYAIRDRHDGADDLSTTYELARPSTKCRYPVLVLTHGATEDRDIGWHVVGYPSLDAVAQDRKDDTLGCYLYRY
jgi:hypothetical protein